jgi:hypothetical protein
MARPTKLTDHARERFIQALSAGNFPEVAARFAGFSAASFYRYMQGTTPEQVAFRADVARAITELEARLVGTIVRAGFTDPRWALIVLERRFKDRWAKGVAAEDGPLDEGATSTGSSDDEIILDLALIDELVPRLLEAGERLRSAAAFEEADVGRFEDDDEESESDREPGG